VLVSGGQAGFINNGVYRWQVWQGNWAAIHIGAGPSHILLEWSSGPNYNYTDTAGVPREYFLEVSSNATDWEERAHVTGNQVRTRTHLLNFGGMSWVRMRMPAGATASLDEIDVYDASGGSYDSWFFLGDSITAHAFDRSEAHGSFAEFVHERWPRFFPAMVDGGVGSDKTQHGLARLDSALAEHTAIQFWAVCLGTNNVGSNNDGYGLDTFRRELSAIVRRIQGDGGRIAVIPQIPFIGRWNKDAQRCEVTRPDTPKFNKVIDEVIAEEGALPGPDLYSYFATHCEQLPDGLHPNAEGYQAMNRLWAEAMAPIYNAYP